MVTQAELLSQTLQQSVQRKQRQQAEAQRVQRLAQIEAQKKVVSQVVQPTAPVQDVSYNRAMEYISAKAQGKKSMALYGDSRAKELVDQILKKNPKIRKAYFAGQSARIQAKARGFESVEEFVGVSEAFQKQFKREDLMKAPVVTGKVYPTGFVGPIEPGAIRAEPTPSRVYPSTFVGPLRPGETRAEPTPSRVYPSTFVGPLQPGAVRAPPRFEVPIGERITIQRPPSGVEITREVGGMVFTQEEREAFPQPQPLAISLPTPRERVTGFFERRGLRDPVTGLVTVAEDIPEAGVEIGEKVFEAGKEVITRIVEAPILRKVAEAPIAQYGPTEFVDPFGSKIKEMEAPGEIITIEDIGVGIGKGTKEFAKEYGKGVGEIYGIIGKETGISFAGIPVENRAKYYNLEYQLREGEITREQFSKEAEKLKTKVTKEEVAKGAETVIGIGTYAVAGAIPGALPILLISDMVAAEQDYKNALELAKKEAKKTYKEYLKEPVEEGYEQVSEEEYMATVVPQFETEIKNQALIAMGTSGAFLVGGALWKVGKGLRKFVPRKKFTFGGRKMSQVKYDKLMKSIEKSQISLAKQEADIFKIRGERELLAPQTTSLFAGKGVSREVVGSAGTIEVSTFADDLFKNFKIFKTKKEAIDFVEGMSKIKTKSADVFTKQAVFAQKIDPLTGKLVEGIYKVGKLPKVGKEWITRGDSYSLSSSWKIKGVDKTITFNYQLGSQGRPINIGLQITTIPPKSNYAEMIFYKAGKKGVYNIKDRLIADVGKMKIIKEGDDIWRAYQPKFRRIKFDKRRVSQYEIVGDLTKVPSKTELKNLFDTGKKVERQAVVEKLTLSGYDINVRSVITDKQALGAVTFGKKYDIKILGVGKKEAELFKIPRVLEGPPKIIKKTPFDVTFGVDKGISPLTLKQVKVLDLPSPTLIFIPKIKPSIVRAPKVIPTLTTTRELPLMVGGAGLVTIPYAGTGMYERTEPEPSFIDVVTREAIIEPAKVEVRPDVLLGARPIVYLGVGPKIISGLKPLVDIKEITKLKTELKTIVTPTFAPALIPKVREIVRPAQVPLLRPKLVEKLKAVQVLVTPTIVTPVMAPRLRPRPTPPKKPVIKIPFPMFEFPRRPRKPLVKKPKRPTEKGYGIEIKRKGKWERVKMPYAFAKEEGAHAVAREKVVKEAAASYRIVESLKPVKKTRKRLTALQKVMFRPGKQKNVMVQKKLLRITTPGEVRQISLKGAAARRGVSTWGLGKPKAKKKIKSKSKKRKTKKKK